MRALVTGGAGFIGSNLVDKLLHDGHTVTVIDNLSTGRREYLESALGNPNFSLVEGDLLDPAALTSAAKGCDTVFHFAANADVRHGLEHTDRDLQQNVVATFNVLEAMRKNQVKRIAFASTGSVYGESPVIPTPENAPFPIQTSLYGASKVAAESMIQAYSEGFGFEGYIFRLVSVLGERYSHGHVFDFYKSLLKNPTELAVCGNGKQRKSYVYVQDCLGAILHVLSRSTAKSAKHNVEIYNIGTDEFTEVNDSIGWISGRLGLKPTLKYAGGDRGWVGDNPFIYLDTKKIRSTGWAPQVTIQEGIVRTLDWLRANPWILG